MGLDPARFKALDDFEKVRWDAALQGMLNRLRGRRFSGHTLDVLLQQSNIPLLVCR